MKPRSIFAPTRHSPPNTTSLWAICYPEDQSADSPYPIDIFTKLYRQWEDVEWLRQFFKANQEDLSSDFWGGMFINEAIQQVQHEAADFEEQLEGIISGRHEYRHLNISDLFQPVHEKEFYLILRHESHFYKGRPYYRRRRDQMLRLYGIAMPEDNALLITGGAIKLTIQNDRPHLERELDQLRRVDSFMQRNGILSIEDFFES